MRMFKKALCSLLLVLMVSMPVITSAAQLGGSTSELENLVNTTIENYSQSFEESSWNSSSEISNIIELYDLDNNINGYIFEISTNGSPSGYIQIDTTLGENIVSRFSFAEEHPIHKMTANSINDLNSKFYNMDNTTAILNNKIIYLGGYDYLINTSKKNINKNIPGNDYYSISESTIVEEEETVLKKVYNDRLEETKKKKLAAENNLKNERAVTKKYVTNANYDILVEMNDFAGKELSGKRIDNHCAPTSATNLIKYWALKRGVTQLYHQNDWWVFTSLFVNLKTNSNSGTLTSNIYQGLWNYSVNTRGVQPSGGDDITLLASFPIAKANINNNTPFLMSLNNYGGSSGGHSVSCFGYYIDGPSSYYIINNGWNKTWTFENYMFVSQFQFVYVRWN